MATKDTTLRNGQANDFAQRAGGADLIISTTNPSEVLVTFTNLSWGSASNGTVQVTGVPRTANATATGVAALARLVLSEGLIQNLVVGTSNAHVVIDDVNITDTQEVKLNSFSFTVPAEIADPV